ncbi:MAG: hypothetical protein RLZZ505_618 [Verrucomicrobiota bacterium]|jgi:opacity protein-like surface antigen
MKFITLLALLLCLIPAMAFARDAKQDARIEHLISHVESLKGAVFIRNGTEYDTKAAGGHLRMKLGKAGDKVKTAEDFINGLASESSTSGKPYQIRKPDGTVVETKAYFYTRLKEYDKVNP